MVRTLKRVMSDNLSALIVKNDNEHIPDNDLFSHSVPFIAINLSPTSIFPFTAAGDSGSS